MLMEVNLLICQVISSYGYFERISINNKINTTKGTSKTDYDKAYKNLWSIVAKQYPINEFLRIDKKKEIKTV